MTDTANNHEKNLADKFVSAGLLRATREEFWTATPETHDPSFVLFCPQFTFTLPHRVPELSYTKRMDFALLSLAGPTPRVLLAEAKYMKSPSGGSVEEKFNGLTALLRPVGIKVAWLMDGEGFRVKYAPGSPARGRFECATQLGLIAGAWFNSELDNFVTEVSDPGYSLFDNGLAREQLRNLPSTYFI